MKNTKRMLALLLAATIFVNAFVVCGFSFISAAEGEFVPTVYNDSFDYEEFQGPTLYDTDVWCAENPDSGNKANFTAVKPITENGVLKLNEGMSAQFNWAKINGFAFDAAKTYTLKFDIKITDFGDDVGIREAWKRELYFAPCGYYNQIELRNNNGTKCISSPFMSTMRKPVSSRGTLTVTGMRGSTSLP